MANYVGLSIGPIYKTLSYAKKTKEIWGASYLFSYIMKEIIRNLSQKVDANKFITPYVENSDNFFKDEKIGKFHDRLIFEGDKKELEDAINKVLENFDTFFKNYLNFFIVDKETSNPLEINELLNSAELFGKLSEYKKDKIEKFIDARKEFRFKSLPEIAIKELGKNFEKEVKEYEELPWKKKDEKELFEKIAKHNALKPYHKYIAIVHADGDNLSKALKNGEISTISKQLFEFSNKAVNVIEKFGGEVVYAGGDDLLFFAPVKNGNTIFHLLEQISSLYEIKDSTISFGVSISYYKFPMNEALKKSRDLLYKAKQDEKNSIAFEVIKHSGQTFNSVFHKNKLTLLLKVIDFENDDAFLHSLSSKLSFYKNIIINIWDDKNMLDSFFKNYFNENYSKYEQFFELVSEFIFVTKDYELIYSTIRFMKFLKGDK